MECLKPYWCVFIFFPILLWLTPKAMQLFLQSCKTELQLEEKVYFTCMCGLKIFSKSAQTAPGTVFYLQLNLLHTADIKNCWREIFDLKYNIEYINVNK